MSGSPPQGRNLSRRAVAAEALPLPQPPPALPAAELRPRRRRQMLMS
jgi:hypothetical protein